MAYLTLAQTLDYLRPHFPSPFDLPQLADLCREGKLTPLTMINAAVCTDDSPPYPVLPFSGYVFTRQLQNILDRPDKVELIRTAYAAPQLDDRGTWQQIWLTPPPDQQKKPDYYEYERAPDHPACDGYIYYYEGIAVRLADIRFSREQVELLKGETTTENFRSHAKPITNTTERNKVTQIVQALASMAKLPLDSPFTAYHKLQAHAQQKELEIPSKDVFKKWLAPDDTSS